MNGCMISIARLDDEIAKAFAYEVEPRGCLCGNNGGGDCEWCIALAAGKDGCDE